MKPTDDELERRFCSSEMVAIYSVSAATLELAKRLRDICPDRCDMSLVLTALEDVRVRAIGLIAKSDLVPSLTRLADLKWWSGTVGEGASARALTPTDVQVAADLVGGV